MSRLTRKSTKTAGSAPGTLIHVGEKKTDRVHLSMMHYAGAELIEQSLDGIETALPRLKPGATTWINIDGIHDVTLIEQIGRLFHIHPLTLEDILNTTMRPKDEAFDEYLFVVLKMVRYDATDCLITAEQISLILGENVLLSFQEAAGDVFEPVRERIRKGKGRIRTAGCDYLAYALLDAIVDHYYVILEKLGERLEALEESIDEDADAGMREEIHDIRRELIYLRKQVWPLREVVAHLLKGDNPFIGETTGMFLRDVYDHTIQAIDTIESFRDTLSSLQDLYLSTISNRMNEVMKVLTIIATIFIPISFIAGVYGMNFSHMPELGWRWGYLTVWLVIIAVVVAMLLFFKRKKWL
ncbi:magnesium/cobalt transporter CorA [Desulfosarcina ovata]|uniref:Magnesium transport protein CorA n=1 Tax=Desulfosarcina ovata subsp. ovata TaxID=2752305 RepID=A0A5K8AGZ5_9BACT|nr:magnesium/cobalt transporter CorA [Desulfosarcina ovata]BBO91124.1 magnesium and cobalt transport protein CorA [Desulfosarcina ovata subsp. ovata]